MIGDAGHFFVAFDEAKLCHEPIAYLVRFLVSLCVVVTTIHLPLIYNGEYFLVLYYAWAIHHPLQLADVYLSLILSLEVLMNGFQSQLADYAVNFLVYLRKIYHHLLATFCVVYFVL